jgi:thiol-disulfide isomerase/thioredoxin
MRLHARLGQALSLLLTVTGLGSTAVSAAEPVELQQLRGKVVYLDFWASWCAPCRQSFPWMQAMQQGYAAQGLVVVAVNVDRQREAAETFLRRFHPAFPVRFDPEGIWAQQFRIEGMPASAIIDRHGVTRFTHIGFRPQDGATYEQQIRQLLAEP